MKGYYLVDVNDLLHSPKGTTWKDHKYIKKENGRYIYPGQKTGASVSMVGELNYPKYIGGTIRYESKVTSDKLKEKRESEEAERKRKAIEYANDEVHKYVEKALYELHKMYMAHLNKETIDEHVERTMDYMDKVREEKIEEYMNSKK